VVLVLVLDCIAGLRSWPVPVVGLLDEPAHLATAWLGLAALTPAAIPRRLWQTALVASVAIDIDHVPLYLTGGRFAVDGGRPPTHGLLTVAVLVVVGTASRASRWAWGVAAGVLLHFVRDIATGPGLPALWPAHLNAELPYPVYVVALCALAAVTVVRARPSVASAAP